MVNNNLYAYFAKNFLKYPKRDFLSSDHGSIKFENIPLESNGPHPPLLCIQLSKKAKPPITKIPKCNQNLDFLNLATFLTPSSISILKKSLTLVLPKSKVKPTLIKITKEVAANDSVGFISVPDDRNDMKPTASSTNGTDNNAKT